MLGAVGVLHKAAQLWRRQVQAQRANLQSPAGEKERRGNEQVDIEGFGKLHLRGFPIFVYLHSLIRVTCSS